jgi:ornithine cyclodeaminase/alanine dehydrogenase-like protein (mu-crystallin family)
MDQVLRRNHDRFNTNFGDTMIDPPLLITREDVQELIEWEDLYEAVREGLIAGEIAPAASAVSEQVHYAEGSLHLKSAALDEREILSVKANLRPTRGGVSGVLLAYDLHSQRLAGIIDGGLMTSMRTGAIGAIAAERLSSFDDVTVAVLGSGPVGLSLTKALLRVLNVAEVRLWSRTPSSSITAVKNLASFVSAASFETVKETISGATIVVTATPSSSPILTADGLAPGTLILAMGADTAGKREVDSSVLDAADVYADIPLDACRVGESAHLSSSAQKDVVAISQLLTSKDEPKRDHPYLVFDSVGSSYVDAAVTALIMRRARERGIGSPVHLRD